MRLLAERALKVGELHNRHGRVRRAADRRAGTRNVNAFGSRRFEANQNLGLRPKGFDKNFPTSCWLLLLQGGANFLPEVGLIAAHASLVLLIEVFDLLVGDQIDLGSYL